MESLEKQKTTNEKAQGKNRFPKKEFSFMTGLNSKVSVQRVYSKKSYYKLCPCIKFTH